MKLDTSIFRAVTDSRLLYGFILHHLHLHGATHKQELYGKVKRDVKYSFPNLDPDYFHSRFHGSSDFIFTTVFYFAVFHLRDKGYGLIQQTIKKNEPMISLSSIGQEFLRTPAAKDVFIDYQDIESFLRQKHAKILERNAGNLEEYQKQFQLKQQKPKKMRAENPNGIFHFKPMDIILGLIVVGIIALIMKYFDGGG